MKRLPAVFRPAISICLALAVIRWFTAFGQSPTDPATTVWSERETRLANEYLSLLVDQPEEGRVLDLLWQLYATHGETVLLLRTIAAQATTTDHPSVKLIHAHLLRKNGDLAAALSHYQSLLQTFSTKAPPALLRSTASLAIELDQPELAILHLTTLAKNLPSPSPERGLAWLELGDLHLSIQQTEPAASAWSRAIEEQPESLAFARQVAQRLLQVGRNDQAASLLSKIVKSASPTEKLDALLDLARIEAHADRFAAADAALRQGLALLHFKEPRYTEFFQRRVRLHERFDKLDDLRTALQQANATASPAQQEPTLHALVQFFTLTVQAEERLKVLRLLVEAAPQVDSYRWEWVRAVLDAGEVSEALSWLDARLSAAGENAPIALVLLRAEADLRSGQAESATQHLITFLDRLPADSPTTKEVQNFATQHQLDSLLQRILQNRIQQPSAKGESYFELAAHLRSRQRTAEAQAVLDQYLSTATDPDQRLQHLAEITAFLTGGSDLESALAIARSAVALPQAGPADWLRLADLLIDQNQLAEAETWLDKAYAAAADDEQRSEIDERLYSLLQSNNSKAHTSNPPASTEFKLPNSITGSQFGSDAPSPNSPLSPALQTRLDQVLKTARLPSASAAQQFRAAWWALRCEQIEVAYQMLLSLTLDPRSGQPRTLSFEAESLLLELAQLDSNRALIVRLLRRQMERDPSLRTRAILRLAELSLETEQLSRNLSLEPDRPALIGESAVKLLRKELARDPRSEPLLAALSRILILRQQPDEALRLWKEAAAQASGSAAIPLLERQVELLLTLQDLPDHVSTGIRLLELESDVNRRRESFRRFLDRLTAADARGAELDPSVIRDRLQLVAQALQAAASRQPFDAFYPEALAHVHTRANDPQAAFAAMKRAYYTAPETPFSLEQLRDTALQVEDLTLAIYFQKQVTVSAPAADLATESRRLVELLERGFQIDEADQVRRRLERRFAQDTKALTELSEHYQSTGQDEAERRVKEQIVRVRPYDARARFALAQVCLRVADDTAAREHLEQLLKTLPLPKNLPKPFQQLALPLSDVRPNAKRGSATDLAELLNNTSHLDTTALEVLRNYLRFPRPEFALAPDADTNLRLRCIEELAKWHAAHPSPALTSWQQQWAMAPANQALEAVWALYYSAAGSLFDQRLAALLAAHDSLESDFAHCWLLLRQHRLAAVIPWMKDAPNAKTQTLRRNLLLTALSALVDMPSHAFSEEGMTHLAEAQIISHVALDELSRKLADRQRYEPALALGEWLRQNVRSLTTDYTIRLGRLAEAAERWDLARHYLTLAVQQPTAPGRYQGVWDPFVNGVGLLTRSAGSRQTKQQVLQQAWQHLQKTPASDLTTLRRSVVAGLAGADSQAVTALDRWVRLDFLANRPMGLRPGGLMPQGSLRFEEAPQAQTLWEETREIGALMSQQGLAPVTAAAEARLLARWGSIQLGPRPGYEYNELRINELIRQLRLVSHPERLQLIRRWLAPVDMRAEASVELLSELGAKLEAAGLARAALDVYWRLPDRAPTNSEYVQWVLRACENAMEVEPGKSFALHLINAVPPFKPPTPGDEALREIHARFLAMNFDLRELQSLAQPALATTLTLPGRLPPETSYLREYARLLEKVNRPQQALIAWKQYDECFLHHDDDGLDPDIEGTLRRAQLLVTQNQTEPARQLLKAFPITEKAGTMEDAALLLQTKLSAQANDSTDLPLLMRRAVAHHSTRTVTALAQILLEHKLQPLALNLLIQAERAAKSETDRFQLRWVQLGILSQQQTLPAPDLQRRLASLFRCQVRGPELVEGFLNQMADLAKLSSTAGLTATLAPSTWVRLLTAQTRNGQDRTLAASALACWASHLDDSHFQDLIQAWQETAKSDSDRLCIQLAARHLLNAGRPQWTMDAATVAGSLPSLRRQGRLLPIMLEAAHEMNDIHRVQEIAIEVVQTSSPDRGSQLHQWTTSLLKIQRPDLAREILKRTLDQARQTDSLSTTLARQWATFLISQREFSAAETFILQHDYLLTNDLAQLLFELHQTCSQLQVLPQHVLQYQLPKAIQQELLWKAGQLSLPET